MSAVDVAPPLLQAAAERIDPDRLKHKFSRNIKERIIEWILFAAAFVSVATTLGIVFVLVWESIAFFREVPVWTFLTDTMWTPLFAEPRYGILPLLTGTLLSTFVGLCVAGPLGLTAAIYLSEFASPGFRETVKPVLELLSGVPTVVFGFFALLFVTPLLQATLLPNLPGFNILSAGIVIGIMIIPYVASLSEDALRAVPNSLRDGSLALGATQLETAFRVVRYPGWRRRSCSGFRARWAKPWWSRSRPGSSRTLRSIPPSRRPPSPPTSSKSRSGTCRTAA